MREFDITEACEKLHCDNDTCLRANRVIKTRERYIRVVEYTEYGENYIYNLCLQCALNAIEIDMEFLEELYEEVDRMVNGF